MKKLYLISFLILTLFESCGNQNKLVGKKYFILSANLDAISIKEVELMFVDENKLKMVPTVYCNPMECYTKENSPKRMNEETYETYNYDDKYHLLTIDNNIKMNKLEFLPNGDIETSKDGTYYAKSINDLDEEGKQDRVDKLFDGNKGLGKVFAKLLNNGDPKPLIEHTSDGRLRMAK